jgi:rhodanese-related sulfurtransferase
MSKFTEPNALKDEGSETSPIVVDVRNPDEYAAGHVTNAINIPVDQLEARQAEIPQDRPVVTYCNMYHPGSSRGERAADLLQALDFQASVLNGGYPAWVEANKKEKP